MTNKLGFRVLCTLMMLLLFTPTGFGAEDPYKSNHRIQKTERIFNLRDFGGYKTKDGKRVVRGILFRSGELSYSSQGDVSLLRKELKIRTVIDLRYKGDRAFCPDKRMKGVKNISIPLRKPYATVKIKAKGRYRKFRGLSKTAGRKKFLRAISGTAGKTNYGYEDTIAFSKYGRKQLGKVFKTLLREGDDGGILLHCVHGKDRTGVASVLILISLGVDEETAIKDYKVSGKLIEYHAPRKYSKGKIGVRERNIRLMLKKIKSEYGSYDKYFRSGLKLNKRDLKELKQMYTE